MKQLRQAIEERVAETAEADLPLLFSRKLPQKGFSEEWLTRNLEKYGAKLLTSEGWLREIPEVDSGEFPQLTTLGDLAAHLRLSVAELEWFADLKGRNPDEGPLAHYRYRWIPKRRGGRRLLMEPKESLKMMQRRILETVLDLVPLHEAAHGFRKGRSIRTFAEPHCGKKAILHNGPDLAEKDVLRGKIAAVQMLNPQRGAKLLQMFAEARWRQGKEEATTPVIAYRTP